MASNYPNVALSTTSPNENSQYLRANFIPYGSVVVNRQTVNVPDILNTSYLNVINGLTPNAQYTFTTGQQITTQAFYGTGTTSTWWMIAMQNAYIHPLQMQNGDIVFIPNCNTAINGTNVITSPPTPSTVSF
jgi:hypothetical protein